MKSLGVILIVLMCAFVITELDPSPYAVFKNWLMLVLFVVFVLVYFKISDNVKKQRWLMIAGLMCCSYLVSNAWFWLFVWKHGFWWPSLPRFLSFVFHVDGESAYNAEVAEMSIIIFVSMMLVFALARRIKE